ncbi:MAG: NUDIX domain-containing protein [Candidatus Omnitrophica bacterium]|nr:NUDIX domain-containing protein [Candidatus Omnitrophota bacterium]
MCSTQATHKVVVVILYDENGNMLLQHRSEDTPRLPGYWAFFGGAIDAGETPCEAVRREAYEELDYVLQEPECIFEQDVVVNNQDVHMWVFVEYFSGDKNSLKLQEGQGWGWYTLEDTQPLKMIDHDRVILEKIFCHIQTTRI